MIAHKALRKAKEEGNGAFSADVAKAMGPAEGEAHIGRPASGPCNIALQKILAFKRRAAWQPERLESLRGASG